MGKLNFNDSALRYLAQHRPPDREGRLLYRISNDSYRERWFRLCGNLLFYFRTNDMGAIADASDPLGVLVLAQCQAQIERSGDRPFVFSILFDGEEKRKHFFSGQSQNCCVEWVDVVRNCSHSSLKLQMETLRQRIQQITGSDPIAKPVFKVNYKAVKQQPPPIAPPPVNHKTATFYVDRIPDAKGQSGFTSFIDKQTASSQTLQLSQSGTAPQSLKPSGSTNSIARDDIVDNFARDVRIKPAEAASFSNWEKFN